MKGPKLRGAVGGVVRGVVYLLAFLVPAIVAGQVAEGAAFAARYGEPREVGLLPDPPRYDPAKPTVAVLLGRGGTVVNDFLTPYQLFAASGRFNVYAVAPERRPTPLDGGLDVLPHHSLADLDRLLGDAPDVVVVPGMFGLDAPEQRVLQRWLRDRAGGNGILFSVCTGSEVLAEAGLLDGRRTTVHWAEIDDMAALYPQAEWVRGVRYVDDGDLVAAAGITAGIDGSLHVLDRLAGRAAAVEVARRVGYPNLHFLDDPAAPQQRLEPADLVFLLYRMYGWTRPDLGVVLYDGVGEIELASVMDAYAATYAAEAHTLAPSRGVVTTGHGLHLVPRWDFEGAPGLDRLLVPGRGARATTGGIIEARMAAAGAPPAEYVHDDPANRLGEEPFVYDAPFVDLARSENLRIARFAAKRSEIVSAELPRDGRGWPVELLIPPVALGLAGLAVAAGLERGVARLWRSRRRTPVAADAGERSRELATS
jgi:putative intracellular protease/amidase